MTTFPLIAKGARRRGVACVAGLSLGQAIAAGVAAFATRDAFTALRADDLTLGTQALVSVAAAGGVIAIFRLAERVMAEWVGQDYAAELRMKLFTHLTRMPARDLAARRNGALALRFVGDLSAVRGWVSLGLARLISASIVLPAAAVILVMLDPAIGLAAMAPVVLGLLAMALLGARFGEVHHRFRRRKAALAADLSERAPHAPELRLLGRVSLERRSIARKTERVVAAALARTAASATLRAIPDAVAGCAAACLLFAALSTEADPAAAAGALAALGLTIQPMRNLSDVWDRRRAWVSARAKCAVLLARPTIARRQKASGPAKNAADALSFKRVRVSAHVGLLHDGVTRNIAPGQRVALVGGNGVGKSTLLALAAGLEAPSGGHVRVFGRAPTALNAAARRRLITLVGPRSPILAGSLRRNLTLGAALKLNDAALLEAAQAFGLGAAVARLGGLDGIVAEAGRTFSSGERQRLLLTRAAVSGSALMLLDEPEQGLGDDARSVFRELLSRTGGTVLFVTHDPGLAEEADEIWRLTADAPAAAA